MQVQGLRNVVLSLQKWAAKVSKEANSVVAVGYTANYALYVHEDIEMKWKGLPRRGKNRHGVYWGPHGQAKFLEQPAREMRQVLSDIVVKALQRGQSMAQALLLAGLRLQRESQQLVPVDTGNLRASAFTRLEK